MATVITYGTFDLLHYGHVRLLERAKALGDYLIVGVTADDFDKTRGKINVQQSLMERIEGVKATGLADKIIVEEYEGQKIDDILRYNVDVFTVGSDWDGTFDYLKAYCKVIYLERTEGVSSSQLRAKTQALRIGLVGNTNLVNKFYHEAQFVNGVRVVGVCTTNDSALCDALKQLPIVTPLYDVLLSKVDAVYIISSPQHHYPQIKQALQQGKHVLVESPIALRAEECEELFALAKQKNCILMEGIKTAYATAYSRMILLAKSGMIGDVVSVESTCTSLRCMDDAHEEFTWNSISAWGPNALLPVFQLLGTAYSHKHMVVRYANQQKKNDAFTSISFVYPHAVAAIRVGQGVKSEGDLVISGTKGYIYVPAPWWKTEYFEVRFEDPTENKRYFYQLDGEGIRYEIVAFVGAVSKGLKSQYIERPVSYAIADIMDDFYHGEDMTVI